MVGLGAEVAGRWCEVVGLSRQGECRVTGHTAPPTASSSSTVRVRLMECVCILVSVLVSASVLDYASVHVWICIHPGVCIL